MGLIAEHFDRHQQLTDIQGTLPHLYAQLLSKFEIQKKELVEYKTKAHYWEAQFNTFKSREDELKSEIEELKAQLRKREQQLFGKNLRKPRTENIRLIKKKTKRKADNNQEAKVMVEEITVINGTTLSCSISNNHFFYFSH